MKALVTGGAGFIGSTLVDRILAAGHHVEVVDDLSTGSFANLAEARREASGRLKIHQCDVGDDQLVDLAVRRQPEVVFHLAGPTRRSERMSAASELAGVVVGTAQALAAADAAGARKIVIAGAARASVGQSTRSIAQKTVIELADLYRHRNGLEYTVVVLPTVFGPRQHRGTESSVVATFAERLVTGQPCVLHGGGVQTRDLLYVDDAVDALVKAVDHGDGLTIEVGTGTQTSIADLHRAMAAVVGSEAEPVPGAARAGDADAVPVDPARAKIYLGWQSWTGLAEGITDTIVSVGS